MTALVYVYDDGWRLAAVAREGRRKAVLLTVGDLRKIEIPVRDLGLCRPADDARPRRVAKLIEEKSRQLRRHGKRVPVALIKQACARLRTTPV